MSLFPLVVLFSCLSLRSASSNSVSDSGSVESVESHRDLNSWHGNNPAQPPSHNNPAHPVLNKQPIYGWHQPPPIGYGYPGLIGQQHPQGYQNYIGQHAPFYGSPQGYNSPTPQGNTLPLPQGQVPSSPQGYGPPSPEGYMPQPSPQGYGSQFPLGYAQQAQQGYGFPQQAYGPAPQQGYGPSPAYVYVPPPQQGYGPPTPQSYTPPSSPLPSQIQQPSYEAYGRQFPAGLYYTNTAMQQPAVQQPASIYPTLSLSQHVPSSPLSPRVRLHNTNNDDQLFLKQYHTPVTPSPSTTEIFESKTELPDKST